MVRDAAHPSDRAMLIADREARVVQPADSAVSRSDDSEFVLRHLPALTMASARSMQVLHEGHYAVGDVQYGAGRYVYERRSRPDPERRMQLPERRQDGQGGDAASLRVLGRHVLDRER